MAAAAVDFISAIRVPLALVAACKLADSASLAGRALQLAIGWLCKIRILALDSVAS